MLLVIERSADRAAIRGRISYTSLVQIFRQQCEVVEGRVVVLAKTGGDVIQNPSDPDATYDGHKGQGDQVPLSETCSAEDDVQLITGNSSRATHHVQLITGVIPETACASDSEAVRPMREQLAANGLTPEQMAADTASGRDENHVIAESFGVERIAPVPGRCRAGAGPRSSSGSRGTDARRLRSPRSDRLGRGVSGRPRAPARDARRGDSHHRRRDAGFEVCVVPAAQALSDPPDEGRSL